MTIRTRAAVVCLALLTGTPFATVVEAAESRLTGISLLRSGERVSVAVDMTSEPTKVVMRNVTPTILEVEVGPISGRIDSQQLTPSADVPFVSQVSVREFSAAQQRRFVRLRMTLRNPSRSNVRVVGGTVYVDLAELPARSQRLPSRAALSAALRPSVTPSRPAAEPSYRETVDASVARMTEMGPFLLSAAGSPSPDVLAAVSQTLTTIHDSLRAVDVPSSAAPAHDLLTSAVVLATRAVAADFSGDRVAQVRRALALVNDAKAVIP